MRLTISLLLISLLTSCIECQNEKIESKSQKDSISRTCALSLNLFGAPWDDRYYAMFNYNEEYRDSLVIGKCSKINQKDSCIHKRIYLTPNAQDSLYSLFQDIKTNFALIDKPTGVKDGVKVRVSILAGANSVNYSYYGLTENEIIKLVKFINRRLPEEFQMY